MKHAAVFLYLFVFLIEIHAGNIFPGGNTIAGRFAPPVGYVRETYRDNSFRSFLRNMPLKQYGAPVLLFDGREKPAEVHASVLDVPILKKDLIQCADAIILLRAEYLFRVKRYDEISFTITNGMRVPFSRFADGYRVKVRGAKAAWKKAGHATGRTRAVFDEYLQFMYAYAGTRSLDRDLKRIRVSEIDIGDVFIQGGSPGHAVIVVDMSVNRNNGRKKMLLAQSFMPSQEIHVLKSFTNDSPWYDIPNDALVTPEWRFNRNCVKRF